MARGRAHVTITGLARLRDRLEDLPDEIKQALVKGVRESAEAVRDDVERTVPVDTSGRDSHHLKDTVDIRYREDDLVADVGWFNQEDYYAFFVERGTRSRPAQPSLHPALERERGRYQARLTDEVRRALR
ncbi:HK97-gp10 family putative phage morphogenesis protein [Streptomyces sp. S.PB5]|uniref:HK97-gp10 family putative phage morphogenesis protein n=1 Tax=Streptomyces sp. S.PB5 TaxID=3020844 RepID=UPI0025AEF978|nr:HK97-gp10 family putative phage morphogenesis protein [Streptomyces sp. S.PB5]MDN3021538.1 HK97 gp10 family phage protein [Streptomyces sp. S.PB5]